MNQRVFDVPVVTFTPKDIDAMLCFGGRPETLIPLVKSGQIKLGGGLEIGDLAKYAGPNLVEIITAALRRIFGAQ